MRFKLFVLIFFGVLISVSYVNAQSCIVIGGVEHCCSDVVDNVCPEDYESGLGAPVTCGSFVDGDCPFVTYQCSDGIDNDGDGCIDFAKDFGCISSDDNDESPKDSSCRGDVGKCEITDAYWTEGDLKDPLSNINAPIGKYVFLVVEGNNECTNEEVSFSIGDVKKQPEDVNFNGGKAVSWWLTEKVGNFEFTAEVASTQSETDSRNKLIVTDDVVRLESIKIEPSELNLQVRKTHQYEVYAYYTRGEPDKITKNGFTTYLSDNINVVTVGSPGSAFNGGLATAVGSVGQKATITAKFPAGVNEKDDSSDVTLINGPTEYVLLEDINGNPYLELDLTSKKIGEFDLYYYQGISPKIKVDISKGAAIFSSFSELVAIVSDLDFGKYIAVGQGVDDAKGEYVSENLYDEAMIIVDNTNIGSLPCGNGKLDSGEECDPPEWSSNCHPESQSCNEKCMCVNLEVPPSGPLTEYGNCLENPPGSSKYEMTKTTRNSETREIIKEEKISCTPIGTAVPFFGWVHVLVTIGMLIGYYVWRTRKIN